MNYKNYKALIILTLLYLSHFNLQPTHAPPLPPSSSFYLTILKTTSTTDSNLKAPKLADLNKNQEIDPNKHQINRQRKRREQIMFQGSFFLLKRKVKKFYLNGHYFYFL
jgi:hypothetical protein